MASKVHPATPEQPNEMSLVERVRMIEFFTQQRQIEKQRKQWYNRPTQGRRWQGDFNGNRGRGRSTLLYLSSISLCRFRIRCAFQPYGLFQYSDVETA
ncbi:hypothetical protein Y032_0657g1244 [Ancylostoma ceylanicum]|uniref:Uncharacterized protein n=1 Tax=Ancylostoma ceylanicum TaxID=53326 RepID=A0A016WID4_9BILA|nr:hypothetical protein Y032_0657g1244 [Ancylostoma ceylanicum]